MADILEKRSRRHASMHSRPGVRFSLLTGISFTFEYAYLFDEIISDLPQVTQAKPKQEIHELYLEFSGKAPQHLKKCGVDFVCDRAAVCGRGSAASSGVSGRGDVFAQ